MATRTILFGLMILIVPVANGATIGFNDWTTSAQLTYQPHPHASFGDPFPAFVTFRADVELGTLELYKFEIYNDTRTALAYSIGPQSLAMALRPSGSWEGFFDAEGFQMRTLLFPRGIVGSNWQLLILPQTPPPINQSMFALFPWITVFKFTSFSLSVPEPATAGLCLTTIVGLFTVRRSQHARCRFRHC